MLKDGLNKINIIVACFLFITIIYELLFDELFQLSNIIITKEIKFTKLIVLLIPLSQMLILVLIITKKKVLFLILGIAFVLPFIVSKSKSLIINIQFKKRYSSYTRGVIGYVDKNKLIDINNADSNNVYKAIQRAADYLINSILENGQFLYKRNLNPAYDKTKNEYNILRHAGAIYSVVPYMIENNRLENAKKIYKAGLWLKTQLIYIEGSNRLKAIWSPVENEDTEFSQAKLGGSALCLIALMEIEKLYPGFTDDSTFNALGNFITFMQKENGDFYSRYNSDYGGKLEFNKSLFYPGQAILSLVYLYEYSKEKVWIEKAVKGLGFLIKQRKFDGGLELDHWFLIATNKILPHLSLPDIKLSYNDIIEHSKGICKNFIEYYKEVNVISDNYGCLSNDGSTCYTASTVEGLTSALQFIPDTEVHLKKKINVLVRQGIIFLLRAQIKEQKFIGAMPYKIMPWTNNYGEEIEKLGEIRIDYVQHSLSALRNYYKLNLDIKKYNELSTQNFIEQEIKIFHE